MFNTLILALGLLVFPQDNPILVYSEPEPETVSVLTEAPPVPEPLPKPEPMPVQMQAEYTIEEVQKAETATISPDPESDGVLIRSTGLDPTIYNQAAVTTDERAIWGTITIPETRNVKVSEPGLFLIRGPPEGITYTFMIWPVELGQPPAILTLEIPPVVPPEPPAPELDLTSLTQTVSVSVTTLNDQVTQDEIVKTLRNAKGEAGLKTAVRNGLINAADILNPPYKDWENGFRVPLQAEIDKLKPLTDDQYDLIIQALIEVME